MPRYRPLVFYPYSSNDIASKYLKEKLNRSQGDKYLITGDFNVPLSDLDQFNKRNKQKVKSLNKILELDL